MADLTPPHDTEVEQALLGAVLIDAKVFEEQSTFLNTVDFYDLRHRRIWEAFCQMWLEDTSIDYLTLKIALEKGGQLKEAGGAGYLMGLVNQCPISWNAPEYARAVRDYSLSRQSLSLANDLAQAAYNHSSREEVLKKLEHFTASCSENSSDDQSLEFTGADLEACQEEEDVSWLIRDWVMEKGITLIAGMPGTGKSFLAMDLAVGMTTSGIAWNGQPVPKGRVMYRYLDGSKAGLVARIKKLCRSREVTANQDLIINMAPLDLRAPSQVYQFQRALKRKAINLVVLDVLARFAPGADENSVAEISPVLQAIRMIAEKSGVTFLIVHHANKTATSDLSTRVRGSTDILAAVDIALMVHCSDLYTENPTRVLSPVKARDTRFPRPLSFQIDTAGDGLALRFLEDDRTNEAMVPGQTERTFNQLRDHLKESPEKACTRSELIDLLEEECSDRTLDRIFQRLRNDSNITLLKKGRFNAYQWNSFAMQYTPLRGEVRGG